MPMKAWKKAIVASALIVAVAIAGYYAYAIWYTINNPSIMRPFVYVSYDWNSSSGFRTETINSTQYHALSPGQNGSVDVILASVPWVDYDQTLTFFITTGNTLGNPALYSLPANATVAISPPTMALPKNGSGTISLIFSLPQSAETGTWRFTLDVVAGISHAGYGFDLAIIP